MPRNAPFPIDYGLKTENLSYSQHQFSNPGVVEKQFSNAGSENIEQKEIHIPPRFGSDGRIRNPRPVREVVKILNIKENNLHPKWRGGGKKKNWIGEHSAARNNIPKPDETYDLDGDGQVNTKDYYFSRMFDKEMDGHLTNEQHDAALGAKKKMEDNLMFYVDGVKKKTEVNRVNAKQGYMDMTHLLKKEKSSGRKSRQTLLKNRRKNNLNDLTKKYKNKLKTSHQKGETLDLPKPQTLNEKRPLHERSKSAQNESYKRQKRKDAGLTEYPTEPNQHRAPSPTWNPHHNRPKYRTANELRHARSEQNLKDLKISIDNAKKTFTPAHIKIDRRWQTMLENRSKYQSKKTLTELKNERKEENTKIAKEMDKKRHISTVPHRFGTNETPWYKSRATFQGQPTKTSEAQLQFERMTHKKTEHNRLTSDTFKEKEIGLRDLEMELEEKFPTPPQRANPFYPPRDRNNIDELCDYIGRTHDGVVVLHGAPNDKKELVEGVKSWWGRDQAGLKDLCPMYSSFSKDFVFHEPEYGVKRRKKTPMTNLNTNTFDEQFKTQSLPRMRKRTASSKTPPSRSNSRSFAKSTNESKKKTLIQTGAFTFE